MGTNAERHYSFLVLVSYNRRRKDKVATVAAGSDTASLILVFLHFTDGRVIILHSRHLHALHDLSGNDPRLEQIEGVT